MKTGKMGAKMETALMRMKYAFATVFVKRIIEADEKIHPEEEKFFMQWFPPTLLERLSLNSKELLFDAYVQSLDILPEQLSEAQKKEVFGLLLGASLADDFLDFRLKHFEDMFGFRGSISYSEVSYSSGGV